MPRLPLHGLVVAAAVARAVPAGDGPRLDLAAVMAAVKHAAELRSAAAHDGVRIHRVEAEVAPFIRGDDPWDEDDELPRLALCGITSEGQCEHIADFTTYRDALSFVTKLAHGIDFPERPVVTA